MTKARIVLFTRMLFLIPVLRNAGEREPTQQCDSVCICRELNYSKEWSCKKRNSLHEHPIHICRLKFVISCNNCCNPTPMTEGRGIYLNWTAAIIWFLFCFFAIPRPRQKHVGPSAVGCTGCWVGRTWWGVGVFKQSITRVGCKLYVQHPLPVNICQLLQ